MRFETKQPLLVLGVIMNIVFGHGTVIGDQKANENSYVSILSGGETSFCGGTIIGDGWVVTAAHCVEGRSSFQVVVTENDGTKQQHDQKVFDVVKIIVHPAYDGTGLTGDIAILALDDPDHVTGKNAKALASPGQDVAEQSCDIIGSGITEGSIRVNGLKRTPVIFISDSVCAEALGDSYKSHDHVCIEDQASGSCNGDSGGPMHCDDELVGLATLGLFDCQGAFTLISAYRSWIKDNTGI